MRKLIFFLLAFFSYQGFCQQLDNDKVLDYIQNQRFGEAADYIKASLPNVITDNKIIARLGYLYYMSGNLPEAEKSYLNLLAKDSLNKSTMMSLAQINNRRGNYLAAAHYYKKILKQDSTIFNVYKQLADIAQITQDSSFIYYLTKANTLNPADGDVAYDLSDWYIVKKENRKADSVLNVAIRADSTNLMLYRNKIRIAYVTGKYKEVVTYCEKLFNGGDRTPTIYKWMGNSLFYTSKFQRSIDTFLELEKHVELEEETLSIMARDYQNLGDTKRALECYAKAIILGSQTSGNLFYYYYQAGELYRGLKKYNDAISAYEKSLQYKESPFAYYLLGILYDQELKNKTTAIKNYRKFVNVMGEKGERTEYFSYAKKRIDELTR